jgi:hypothetical protein
MEDACTAYKMALKYLDKVRGYILSKNVIAANFVVDKITHKKR